MIQSFTVSQEKPADILAADLSKILCDNGRKVQRGKWQSENVDYVTYELSNVIIEATCYDSADAIHDMCAPDFPWAWDHFDERISGKPLNPAPSFMTWPWHSAAERDRHRDGTGLFDHTYPERFWPKLAGRAEGSTPHWGVRFKYGDLQDVVDMLKKDPFTRQAYLPVWFPEDTGATVGQRVPCSLGYHFIRNGSALDMNYFIRSCDLTRHFRNDIYLALRLQQWVAQEVRAHTGVYPHPGTMTMFISNLHMFANDEWRYLP